MSVKLPKPIGSYVDGYNARDVKKALASFSENALVQDEGKTYRGTKAIGQWLEETIGRYSPILTPSKIETIGAETVVSTAVAGNFPGSPVNLAFRFTLDREHIAELNIVQ